MSNPRVYSFVLRHFIKLCFLLGKVQIALWCIILCFSHTHPSPKKEKAIRSVLPPPYSWYKMFSWTQDKAKEGQEPEADEVIGLPDDSTTVLIYVL